jgi:hypothetical protein
VKALGAARLSASATTSARTIAVGAILLLAGFGDGIGFSFTALTGQRSPWIVLLPVLVLPTLAYVLANGASSLSRRERSVAAAFGVLSMLVLAEQALAVGGIYVAGLLQLLVFIGVMVVVCGLFTTAPAWLATAFRRSVPAVHYFLTGYVVVAYLTWHLTGWDPSIHSVLTGANASLRYYGFRPSGFGVEPAWSAFALAASYSAVHYLVPRHRLNAFVALVVAGIALQSATAYAFIAAVVALYVFERLRPLKLSRPALVVGGALATGIALVAGAAALTSLVALAVIAAAVVAHEIREHQALRRRLTEVALTASLFACGLAVASFGVAQPDQPGQVGSPTAAGASPTAAQTSAGGTRTSPGPTRASPAPTRSAAPRTSQTSPVVVQPPVDRLSNIASGRDPSAGLRIRSAAVAWSVIQRSFPVGVGYGNFRQHAVYPPDIAAFLAAVDDEGRYKSDFFPLNYVAEIGVLGAVLVISTGALLMRSRQALPAVFVALIAGLSGTLLLPPVLAMAAIVGLLVRERDGARRSDLDESRGGYS